MGSPSPRRLRRVAMLCGALVAGIALIAGPGSSVARAVSGSAPATSSTTAGSATTGPTATSPTAARTGAGTVRLTTPVLSVRRVPDWIEDATADAELAAGLPKLFAKLGPAVASSCLEVTQAGATVFADNATNEEIPASNMKLLTATAVLDKLGPTARLRTQVTATAEPVGGVEHGNLYLVGSGDPLLRTPGYQADLDLPEPVSTSLPQLAAQVRAAGITTVDGSVLGDEALFDSLRTVPTWKSSYAADEDVGPLSALDVNDGFSPTKPFAAASNPAVMAAEVFTGLLGKDGVKVTGVGNTGISPASAVPVTSILSPSMETIVDTVLRVSDDTGAELLTKLLGSRFGGAGTTAVGTAVIRADLAHDGLPVSQLRNLDGSGLDTDDRVPCNLIVDDLAYEGTSGALFPGLPVAGETGTLATEMTGTPAVGRLHAKTGTLDSVAALSGFVMAAAGSTAATPELGAPIIFSFISNNVASYQGAAVADAIGAYLAHAPKVPPRAEALPLAVGS